MADDEFAGEHGGAADGPNPPGPFLREYTPTGPFRHTGLRTTSVLFYRNGGYSVATVSGIRHHGKRPLAGPLARPHTICEIARGTFRTTIALKLPAAGGATFFDADVEIHWTVNDPYLAATEVVTDVAARLNAPTLERLREVSAHYPVDAAERANKAITGYCSSGRWDDLGTELGLGVRLYVHLSVDEHTIEHSAEIRRVKDSAAVTQLRMQMFEDMLKRGDLAQLSFMLAADPDTAKEFLEKIRQEGRQDEKERVDRLFDLVASGQIQSSEAETQALAYLNKGYREIGSPIGKRPARRDTPQIQASPANEPYVPNWVTDAQNAGPERELDSGDPGRSPSGTVYSEPEPPRRRRRVRDDGWSWAEED